MDLKSHLQLSVFKVVEPHIGEKITKDLQDHLLQEINQMLASDFPPGLEAISIDPWGIDIKVADFGVLELSVLFPK